MAMNTPWGESQSQDKFAEGIYFHSTAGHGGVYVPPAIRMTWPAELRRFESTAPGWYEEDCEIAVAILATPSGRDTFQLYQAVKSCDRYYKDDPAIRAYFASERGQWMRETTSAWEAEQIALKMHSPGGGCSHRDGWRQWWHPFDDGPTLVTYHSGYPRDLPKLAVRELLEAKYGLVEVLERRTPSLANA